MNNADDPESTNQVNELPRAVVEVRVPRGPGAVEGKGELLVVLVLLTPHPESREHLLQKQNKGQSICAKNRTDRPRSTPIHNRTSPNDTHPTEGGLYNFDMGCLHFYTLAY